MAQELVSDRKSNVNVTISSRTSDVLEKVLVAICRLRQEQILYVYIDFYIEFHIKDTILLFYCKKLFNLNDWSIYEISFVCTLVLVFKFLYLLLYRFIIRSIYFIIRIFVFEVYKNPCDKICAFHCSIHFYF